MSTRVNHSTIVLALMFPLAMTLINRSMFSVALPGIRNEFGLQADATAWMVTIYSLVFVIGMPIYGRLADMMNRRLLLLISMGMFATGTVVCLLAKEVALLLVGRVVQGLGAASVTPLSMAIITSTFPQESRGRALGSWNSIGPVCFMAGPLLAGFIVDAVGWRAIFGPVLLIGALAMAALLRWLPAKGDHPTEAGRFDWAGLGLLATAATLFIFYVSSRPITGREPLTDFRLALGAAAALGLFIWVQRRAASPIVPLRLFRYPGFSGAGAIAGIRMLSIGTVAVVIPLFLRDFYDRPSTTAGLLLMIHAAFLLLTLRIGGALADRMSGRRLITLGLGFQTVTMALLALKGDSLVWLVAGLVVHGLASGFALAPLHRAAMSGIPGAETGRGAGVYSMLRFTGTMLGSALAGVVLQLAQNIPGAGPYLTTFWVASATTVVGVLIGSRLRV